MFDIIIAQLSTFGGPVLVALFLVSVVATATTIFKAIEFEAWSDIKSVDERTRGELREMLVDAPPKALDALFPEDRNDKLWFYLQELLIAGRRA